MSIFVPPKVKLSKPILTALNESGGGTYQVIHKNPLLLDVAPHTTGYYVGTLLLATHSADNLHKFSLAEDNPVLHSLYSEPETYMLGFWLNPDPTDRRWYIDVTVHEDDREVANNLASAYSQIAFWDIKNQESITTVE